MKKIPLTQGYVALVDDSDYDDLIQFNWYADNRNTRRSVYAIRNTSARTTEWMHTRITGYEQTDHKDRNGLNNQRSNLRPATTSQNHGNMPKFRGTYTSQFKGVYWHKKARKWRAQIGVNSKQIHLGWFTDEIEAAKAYDRAAVKYFGEYALLNFPSVG